jgi:hypothetical protein
VDDTGFDQWLETELDRGLASYTRMTAHPEASRYYAQAERRGPRMFVKSLIAATGTKLVVGGAAVAMAATAVTGATVTGSPSPAAWGQQVQSAVEGCKAALGAGMHGIGDCVSDFAHKHVAADPIPSSGTVAKVEGKSDLHHNKGTEGKSDQNPGKGTEGKNSDHQQANGDPTPGATSAPATADPTPATTSDPQATPTPAPKSEGNSDNSQGGGTEGHSDSTPSPSSTPVADPTLPVHPTHPTHPVHPTHP